MPTQSITLQFASLGTVSYGTCNPDHLLSRFANELEWQIRRNGDYFALPENFGERDKLNNLHGEALDCYGEDGETISPEKEDQASEIIQELQDALQCFAKPYCYFGAHQGDGSDFGYWADHDQIEELPTVEDSDAAQALGEDCKSVNDHGNVTVYGGSGSILLDLV